MCSCYAVYENEDELMWSPGVLSENKVKGFLSDAWSRTANDRTGNDKAAMSVRDNEQVNHAFKCQSLHAVVQW